MIAARGCVLALALAGMVAAQVPAAPEVEYPGGRARLPSAKRRKPPKETKEPLQVYRGTLKSRTDGKLLIETPEGTELEFTCTKDTLFFRKDQDVPANTVLAGAHVMVEGREDQEAFLFAVNVVVEEEAAAESRAPTQEKPRTSPPREPDDPGPPVLHRGKPKALPKPPESAIPENTTPEPDPAETPTPDDPEIAKAREVAAGFTETLPNYIVQQFTTRYMSEKPKADWRALDILSTEVIYLNGKELYRNVRIDNKPVKKPIDELRGTTSHGEFGTTMVDIFQPTTAASFTRMATSDFAGHKAWKYDLNVERPNSHWLTRFGSHSIRPAYHGRIWLDAASHRLWRIELQARNLPVDYPLDVIEWVVEYGSVRIGSHEYLLPVHAGVLGCLRGTSRCSRNSTDFRNYRRFTAESQIYTTESTIDFSKEVAGAAEDPQK